MTSSWACFLQRFSTPWLDEVMYLITNLGSGTFYMVLLPVVYWTWSKRSGHRIVTLFLFSAYLNGFLKSAFHTPRPTPTSCSRVMHPETGGGYAFPSGHAQGTTVVWGQMAVETRRRIAWIAAGVVVFAVSLSRIYLNVHWPIDVAGGILIGSALLALFNALSRWWESLNPTLGMRLAACAALPIAMYLVYRGGDALALMGFLSGLPLGRILEERYVRWNERASAWVNVLKVVAGLTGMLAIRYGLKLVFPPFAASDVIRYAIAGLWASLGAPILFTRLGWHN